MLTENPWPNSAVKRAETLVDFRVLDVQVLPGPDDAEFGLRIDLRLNGDDDEGSNDVEWGGLGFCFVLAVLSEHHGKG